MKQNYFIQIRTMTGWNANKSTNAMCAIVQQKLESVTIESLDDIQKVLEWVSLWCGTVNKQNPRSRKLSASQIWETSNGNFHFTISLENAEAFLQVSFSPVRHQYHSPSMMNELLEVNDYVMPNDTRCNCKQWNPEKCKDGDVIVHNERGDIIIVKSVTDKISFYAYLYHMEKDVCLEIHENGDGTGYGRPDFHYATREEKMILDNELSVLGLKWNPATLKFEKI